MGKLEEYGWHHDPNWNQEHKQESGESLDKPEVPVHTTLVRRRDGESLTDYTLRFMQKFHGQQIQQEQARMSFYRPEHKLKPGK